MANRGDEFSSSFDSSDESFLSGSSPSSNTSVSESNSADVNNFGPVGNSSCLSSATSGDSLPLADEGIYGRIFSLIKEGKNARFIDRQQGIYEMDWQDVVWKYWFEWRRSRRDLQSKSAGNIEFDHRTASNTLRAALLNAYKDKGAVELAEKKVLDSRNRTIKRCFRLPSTMIHKFARLYHKASNQTRTKSVGPKRTLRTPKDKLPDKGTLPSPSYPPIGPPVNFNSLRVDTKESDSLTDYLAKIEDPFSPSNQHDLRTLSTSSDETGFDETGYETFEVSSEENLVKEIDPCEGPYQGGNTAFIFLEDSLYTRFAEAGNRCKVVFFEPKQRQLTAREVTATTKNCFTIKVCVPHCPRLSGVELACGKLTVHVLVKTLDGGYIGETTYTYNSNLIAQFEHCVKALDDEDMEMNFTGSTDEEEVTLNYKQWDTSGCQLFNFASLRVLVFVAVKVKAYNFLTAFLKSPVASSVLQHCKHKLLSFLEAVRGSDRQSDKHTSVLDWCESLLVSDSFKCETTEDSEAMAPSQGAEANASKEEMEKTEKGYHNDSELETDQESEEEVNDGNDENCLHVEHREVIDENEACKDTSIQNECRLTPENTITQQEKVEKSRVNDSPSNKPKMFVLRKPCSPVPISRSRDSFPDPRTDVFVELQVRKSQKENGETSEHVQDGRPHVMQHVPITKHHVIVDVRHSETEQSAKDWESLYVKRVSGKIGYWFRFYKPNCELLLTFTLYDKLHVATKSEMKLRTAGLDHVTVVVQTTSWKGPISREAKKEKDADKLELSLTQQVPLLSLSRSQNRLCAIMKGLHKFCDNGDWEKFDKACALLQLQFPSADIKVAILLEKAIVFLYQHNLEKAEETALEALKITSEAENHQLLAGRAYYYLAHVYRRECKLGEAERCIGLSKQNLHLMDICLDQSFMAYEEGNVMKDFISGGAVLKKTLVCRAKQCFERCLDLCRRLDDSDGSGIPPSHSFALIKIALLLLDCGNTSGRERCVSVNHIQEAKRFLDLLQRRGLNEITERRKIQFHLACSDLQYRMGNYKMAIHNAEEALKKANQFGFALEVMPARNRLTYICQLLERSGYTLEL